MIAALYVQRGGVYYGLPDVDPWDETRDARLYAGPHPVVAHPPCSRWCRLAGLVEARWGHRKGDDGGCFAAALASVRAWGGCWSIPRTPMRGRRSAYPYRAGAAAGSAACAEGGRATWSRGVTGIQRKRQRGSTRSDARCQTLRGAPILTGHHARWCRGAATTCGRVRCVRASANTPRRAPRPRFRPYSWTWHGHVCVDTSELRNLTPRVDVASRRVYTDNMMMNRKVTSRPGGSGGSGAYDGRLTESPRNMDCGAVPLWGEMAARRARTLSVLRAVRACRQSRVYQDHGKFADLAVNMLCGGVST